MIYKSMLAATLIGGALAVAAPTAEAGPEEYMGEIITVGFNFCPRGTLEADGRLLPISQNQALFSLLGTIYGGDGRTTFALPDLRGRTMVGSGGGPGLTPRRMGERGGVEDNRRDLELADPSEGAAERRAEASTGNNMQPFLTVKHCVVVQGIYPSRS